MGRGEGKEGGRREEVAKIDSIDWPDQNNVLPRRREKRETGEEGKERRVRGGRKAKSSRNLHSLLE